MSPPSAVSPTQRTADLAVPTAKLGLTGAAVHLIKNPRLNPDVADKEGFTPLHCAASVHV